MAHYFFPVGLLTCVAVLASPAGGADAGARHRITACVLTATTLAAVHAPPAFLARCSSIQHHINHQATRKVKHAAKYGRMMQDSRATNDIITALWRSSTIAIISRRYASAEYVVVVCLSLCHKAALYQNDRKNWVVFGVEASLCSYRNCVMRKCGYLQNRSNSLWNFVRNY